MISPSGTSGRDLRFDSLRGLMLVCMTVNHLPSALRFLTDSSLGVCSAAEGFVFLSGLLAGVVYTRKLRTGGAPAFHAYARRRATLIYGWHVAAFIAALAAVQAVAQIFGFCSWNSPQLFYSHPWLAVLLGATLLHQPGLLDILPLYCALVVALPWVLLAFERGHRGRVLAASFALWFAVQWAPSVDGAPLYPIHVGSFNLFAWQLLFFSGVAIGHARVSGRPGRTRPGFALIAAAAVVFVYGWGVHYWQWRPPGSDRLFGILVNKPALGGLRLLDFGAVACLVAALGSYVPSALAWPPLAYLGRHSLVLVAVQSVTGMVLLEFPGLFSNAFANWATTGAAIGCLFLAAAAHAAWQRRFFPGGGMRTARPPEGTVVQLDSPEAARAA